MTSTIVSGVWRSHANLDESEPDSSPEAPHQFKKITLRSSSSLNSLRMSLRKRLPLKPAQSNVNISENPTWESLQMNQKTSAVHKMTRSAKNSIGSIYQVIKEPRTTSKELQASLASIKVRVHDSTIRKRLGKNSIHGRVPRQKPLLTKKNTKFDEDLDCVSKGLRRLKGLSQAFDDAIGKDDRILQKSNKTHLQSSSRLDWCTCAFFHGMIQY
uniref:Uncharacterized protein n=1 Tax=Sinocyclocheilus grahami TaxID=75366 RepID=A0A672RPG4_SINGR